MKKTVVIMGAGIAGMAAAKMLASRNQRVILIDKAFDAVAQSTQLHVLLLRGQQLLERHFPEVFAKITSNCTKVDWGSDTYWRSPAGPLPKRQLNVATYLLSRSFLDNLLMDDLKKTTYCDFVKGAVKHLCLSDDGVSVESVTVGDQVIDCDLCIDCLGRGSLTRKILESQFSTVVKTSEFKTSLRYYSFIAKKKSATDFKQVYVQIDPQKESHGCVISPIEENRMIATFITIDKEFKLEGNPFHLIKDDVFQKFVSTLEFEEGHNAFGNLHNRLHRFDHYPQLPKNLFLIGDSVCQFNPVFGQGMTVALESADMLSQFVKTHPDRASLAFQKQLEKSIRFPWLISTMDPYNPGRPRSLKQRIVRSFMHRIMHKCKSDHRAHLTFVKVLHMIEDPRALLRHFY